MYPDYSYAFNSVQSEIVPHLASVYVSAPGLVSSVYAWEFSPACPSVSGASLDPLVDFHLVHISGPELPARILANLLPVFHSLFNTFIELNS